MPDTKQSWHSQIAKAASKFSGRPSVLVFAVALILAWLVSGPMFGYSDTWQLLINTTTTIITFLMVFLIQSSQNRDTEAIQIKLDELIRATQGAHNAIIGLEQKEEDELDEARKRYESLADAAREKVKRGREDTDTPEA